MKITVVTVAYNAEATIADTVRSVAAQTGVDVEHLIVDGASSDRTVEIARREGGPALRVISEPDRGLYDAMDKGLKAASGDVIGFLNADDFFCRTDALAIIAAALEASGADAVAAGVAIVDPARTTQVTRAYAAASFRPWMLRFAHMPPHPGFYVRLTAARLVGGYEPDYRIAGDFDWLVRFYLTHRLTARALPDTLVAMRAGGASQGGLGTLWRLNAEATRSLRRRGVASALPLVWLKYAFKLWQMVGRPRDFPAPSAVRWPPAA